MPNKAMHENKKGNNSKKQQTASEKPKFDKKKWREKKYNKKFQVEAWEKKREKAVLKQYYKELKKDPLYAQTFQPKKNDNPDVTSTTTSGPDSLANHESHLPTSNQKRKKFNSYEAAKAEMRRLQAERDKQKEERLRRKKEMEEQLAKYKKKRAEKFKVLSKKNNKGQPVMKGRLQLLYDQIKQSVNSD